MREITSAAGKHGSFFSAIKKIAYSYADTMLEPEQTDTDEEFSVVERVLEVLDDHTYGHDSPEKIALIDAVRKAL